MSTIGKRICALRKKLGLTQEELALKIGYTSKSTINKIEMGVNDIPQSKITKFAEVLGTTPSFLMGWDDPREINLQLFNRYDSNEFELSDLEKSFINGFRQLPDGKKELIIDIINVTLKKGGKKE